MKTIRAERRERGIYEIELDPHGRRDNNHLYQQLLYWRSFQKTSDTTGFEEYMSRLVRVPVHIASGTIFGIYGYWFQIEGWHQKMMPSYAGKRYSLKTSKLKSVEVQIESKRMCGNISRRMYICNTHNNSDWCLHKIFVCHAQFGPQFPLCHWRWRQRSNCLSKQSIFGGLVPRRPQIRHTYGLQNTNFRGMSVWGRNL